MFQLCVEGCGAGDVQHWMGGLALRRGRSETGWHIKACFLQGWEASEPWASWCGRRGGGRWGGGKQGSLSGILSAWLGLGGLCPVRLSGVWSRQWLCRQSSSLAGC